VLGVGGAAVCTAVGPPLVQTFFGATGLLDRGDFLLLSLGTTAFMAATALGQALVARGSHAAQVVGWAVGLAVLLGGSALPLAMPMRVELAYAAGSLVAALVFAALLSRRAGTAETGPDEDEELYETVLARESATALTEPVD
jgi:O-antigen/teichoic acid export membrane protein